MSTGLPDSNEFGATVDRHRTWLSAFEPWRLADWNRRLSNDPESALCEALVRDHLASTTPGIRPFEDRASGGPDFCVEVDATSIFVEVTAMGRSAVTEATGLSAPVGFQDYRPLTSVIQRRAAAKARQLAELPGPRLLFVATLHSWASGLLFSKAHMKSVLTSSPTLVAPFDSSDGHCGPIRQVARLEDSAFIRPSEARPQPARRSVTGIVGCGFGCVPPVLTAVLHPDAAFPMSVWPWKDIPCGTLRSVEPGEPLHVDWSRSGSD